MYTEKFDNQILDEIRRTIEKASKIVVIAHMNADGDAIGSLLATTLMLENGSSTKQVTPMLPNGCTRDFRWLPSSDRILNGDTQRELCEQCLAEADLIVGVDFNTLSRIDFLQETFANAKGRKLLVDHHHNPDREAFDWVVSDPSISSACELVFWLSEALWNGDRMNQAVATCLYTGIRTDTGGFAFSNSQPSLYEASARLVAFDIEPAEIHNRIMNTFSVERMRFYGFAINNRLNIYADKKAAYFWFTKEDLKAYSVSSEDLNGLVNYTLMMADIEVGALIREEEGRCRISFRAKYDVDVNSIANQLGGGGHTKAAGANTTMNLQSTIAKVEELLGIK